MTSEVSTLEVRSGTDKLLRIVIQKRSNEHATDFLDANWLDCTIEARTGHFSGQYPAALRAEAFASFKDQLKELQHLDKGNAYFDSMEPYLKINLKADCKGRYDAVCLARETLNSNASELKFSIPLDAMGLRQLIESLDRICSAYRVIGR